MPVLHGKTHSCSDYDAVVVGAGPNGLAAAVTVARAGRSVLVLEAADTVGGGTRTRELTLPGYRHDVCSAIHPLALAAPFFRSIDWGAHGLRWIQPTVPLAHPLDDGNAVLLERSLENTAESLGEDGDAYRRLIAWAVHDWEHLVEELLKPLGIPAHPIVMSRFGMSAVQSATGLALRQFNGTRARALFAGNSAHSILPLEQWSSAAFGVMLSTLGHAVGWPIAEGGSQAIADAMASLLLSFRGEIQCNRSVHSLDELPPARAYLFDVTPKQLARIAGAAMPSSYLSRLEHHQYGPGVFKIDWALSDPIPWTDPNCLNAGTLHLGGTLDEIAAAEREVSLGIAPEKPFVLLSQPTLFDPSRAPTGNHVAWAYCHVPNGSTVDMTDRIEAQIERFAPGFRDVMLARSSMFPADMEAYNQNYVGGDIVGGIQSLTTLFFRPLGRFEAYSTPAKGLYLCSSSMPPGGGVHGMCGYWAAKKALKQVL